MRAPVVLTLTAVLLAACGKPEPESPHMGAGKHDDKARSEERAAAAHLNSSDDPLVVGERCLPSNLTANDPIGCWTAFRAPGGPAGRDRDEAREHLRLAQAHRAASQALRDAEARACAGLPERDRAISPFWHRADIAATTPLYEPTTAPDTPGRPQGAIVTLRPIPGMTLAYLQRVVDCQIARADALGHRVPEAAFCPLVPKDVMATVKPDADGFSIVITSKDPDSAREIMKRAEALPRR